MALLSTNYLVLILGGLQHRLDHLVPDLDGISEPRLKEALRDNESLPPRVKVSQAHTLGPAPRGKGEFEVVRPEGVVLDSNAQRLVQTRGAAEQVLRDAQPQPEQRRRADHVVERHDPQRAPAVHHGQQAEVVVGQDLLPLAGSAAFGLQTEAVQQPIPEQRPLLPLWGALGTENPVPRRQHPLPQLVGPALEHELVQLRGGASVLVYLLAGLWVEDGQPGVDVPLLRVDSQHQVDLCVLDASDVPRPFPGELLGRVPRLAHGEEGGVRHGLRVGRDSVVLAGREYHLCGVEALEDGFDRG